MLVAGIRKKDDSVSLKNLRWEIWEALVEHIGPTLCDRVSRTRDYIITITSGSEKTTRHSYTSLHYAGAAVDIRCRDWDVSLDEKLAVVAYINHLLGPDIDFLLEGAGTANEHIHIEWQPKRR